MKFQSGDKFGRLTLIQRVGKGIVWSCRCECGQNRRISETRLLELQNAKLPISCSNCKNKLSVPIKPEEVDLVVATERMQDYDDCVNYVDCLDRAAYENRQFVCSNACERYVKKPYCNDLDEKIIMRSNWEFLLLRGY